MSKELIADTSGVKPGAEGYVETFAPDKPEVVKPEPVTKDDKTKLEPVPYARFTEINERMKTAEKAVDDMKIDQKKISEKKLEEDGEHKILWETEKAEHIKTKETADKWIVYEKERREALMKKIPENVRDIYDGIPLVKLEKAVETISKDGSLGVNVEDPSRHTDMTTEERKKILDGTPTEKREKHQALLDSYKK